MNGRDLFTFSCWILLVDLIIRDLHNNSMDNIRLCSKSIPKIVIEIMELSKRKNPLKRYLTFGPRSPCGPWAPGGPGGPCRIKNYLALKLPIGSVLNWSYFKR